MEGSRPIAMETVQGSQSIIEAGRRRAATSGRPVLVSRACPIADPGDAAHLFAGAGDGDAHRVLWSCPSRDEWVVGLGVAFRSRCEGSRRFSRARESYEGLASDALVEAPPVPGVGPIAFVGGRFDPTADPGHEWRHHGDCLLIVPRLTYARNRQGFWLTENILVQPDGMEQATPRPSLLDAEDFLESGAGGGRGLEDEGAARERWRRAVNEALDRISGGDLQKVVLARRLRLRSDTPFSTEEVLRRLMNSDPECTVFAFSQNGACFLGATPELLVRVAGDQVESVCLAGSAPRGPMPEEDRALGEALLRDAKECREHSLVVGAVAEELKGLCAQLRWEKAPQLVKLRNVQHLATGFWGTNPSRNHVLDYVERLHPTPAVAGSPRDRALRLIREIEGMDRGWYAGPVGWIDAEGGGEFTVAIRSALVSSNSASLYAGAGIVAGSDPVREYAETELKLRSLRAALVGGCP